MEGVEAFVNAGADVNLFDTNYCYSSDKHFRPCHRPFQRQSRATCTPLMIAARSQDHLAIAQYLLAQGADPHLKCPNTGESPVSVAIKHSNADLVQLLIQKYNVKCDPTKALTMTWNLLYGSKTKSCQPDTAEFIELLLKKGAQMDLPYMHVAVGRGWLKVVESFVKRGFDVNTFAPDSCYIPNEEGKWSCTFSVSGSALQRGIRYTPLMIAARSPHLLDIAQYLLAHGADPHLRCPYTGESAVSVATVHSNIDLVRLLIEKYNVKFDPSKVLTMTWKWLLESVDLSNIHDITEYIKLLLKKGARMCSEFINIAISRGWKEVVEVIVEVGADINRFHEEDQIMYTPLMKAAKSPDLFVIAQYLLVHGADPHLKCPNTGESAVSVAIKHSNVDLVRLLIEKYNVECDPSKVLSMTCEWLLESVNMSHEHDITEYLELLLDEGARIDSEFINIAISLGWKAGVEVIVEAGADINLIHEEGRIMYTPLMRAARSPDLFDIAQYLLAQGADPHLRCQNTGGSALTVAIVHCNIALTHLLIQKYNAEFDPPNVLTDMCEWLLSNSHQNEMYKYETTECIKLLLKKGAQMGYQYRNFIELLLPAPNISQDDLHSYFREGFNINRLCKYYIESDNEYCANHIRWFLRHGLDTNAHFIEICFKKALKTQNNEIVTLLLHAGVDRFVITRWVKLRKFPCPPKQLRECNEVAYNEFQEDDLMEFSDESLHIYPEVKELSEDEIDRQYKSMMRLLSHPLTLKGLCRQCLRQSLCEPSPTVVRTLPIPRALKRYILCHDL